MKTYIARAYPSLALALSLILAMPGLPAQEPATAARKLSIVIVDGDGAINNLRQRVAREPIVQVEDENRRPVAGAIVLFTLPNQGAGGVFPNGANTFSTVTDANGRAVARGIRVNQIEGDWEMRVNVSHQGQTASATIRMRNAALVTAGVSTGKLLAILGIVGAAVGGIVAATQIGGNGGGSGPGGPGSTPGSASPGSPSVGPPR